MQFYEIDNSYCAARNAGYEIDSDYQIEFDDDVVALDKKARNDPWGNHLDDVVDSLFDFEGGLYKGEDGEMYVVEFCYVNEAWLKPMCWHRLKKAD